MGFHHLRDTILIIYKMGFNHKSYTIIRCVTIIFNNSVGQLNILYHWSVMNKDQQSNEAGILPRLLGHKVSRIYVVTPIIQAGYYGGSHSNTPLNMTSCQLLSSIRAFTPLNL